MEKFSIFGVVIAVVVIILGALIFLGQDEDTSTLSFLDLTDTPGSYSGTSGYLVAVNGTATGLDFVNAGSGGMQLTWYKFIADSGSVAATSIADELTIAGGVSIDTSFSGKTLTIDLGIDNDVDFNGYGITGLDFILGDVSLVRVGTCPSTHGLTDVMDFLTCGDFEVNGVSYLDGGLQVTGVTALNGNTTVIGDLGVTGGITSTSTISAAAFEGVSLWNLIDTDTGTNNASAGVNDVLTWNGSDWVPSTASGSSTVVNLTASGTTEINIIQSISGSVLPPLPPPDCDVYFHKSEVNDNYYAIDGATGYILAQGLDAKSVIETGLTYVHTNSRVLAGGNGGWYLDTLHILGKKWNDLGPSGADAGFQEVIIDFSQIEFVKTGSTNEDFITIDSALGCEFYFGVITGDVSSDYSLLLVKPGTGVQYSGTTGFWYNKVDARVITYSNLDGAALEVDATVGNVSYNDFLFGNIDGPVTTGIRVLDPQPKTAAYNNYYVNILNTAKASGTGVSLQGGNMGSSHFTINYLTADTGSAGINSPYADGNLYTIAGSSCDLGEVLIFGSSSNNNEVVGGYNITNQGWTDGGSGNIFLTPNSPDLDRWNVIGSDSGTATADNHDDVFTVVGGSGINTSISGDTLTITATVSTDYEIGTAYISSGDTSIIVNHTLVGTPNITCTGLDAEVSSPWISNKTSTQFTINVAIAVTGTRAVDWQAFLR